MKFLWAQFYLILTYPVFVSEDGYKEETSTQHHSNPCRGKRANLTRRS